MFMLKCLVPWWFGVRSVVSLTAVRSAADRPVDRALWYISFFFLFLLDLRHVHRGYDFIFFFDLSQYGCKSEVNFDTSCHISFKHFLMGVAWDKILRV